MQLLEGYLEDRGETIPSSERLSVLSALSFYASRDKDVDRSRRYTQMAQALEQSHSLPDDLVKVVEDAASTWDCAHWLRAELAVREWLATQL